MLTEITTHATTRLSLPDLVGTCVLMWRVTIEEALMEWGNKRRMEHRKGTPSKVRPSFRGWEDWIREKMKKKGAVGNDGRQEWRVEEKDTYFPLNVGTRWEECLLPLGMGEQLLARPCFFSLRSKMFVKRNVPILFYVIWHLCDFYLQNPCIVKD